MIVSTVTVTQVFGECISQYNKLISLALNFVLGTLYGRHAMQNTTIPVEKKEDLVLCKAPTSKCSGHTQLPGQAHELPSGHQSLWTCL